MFRNRKKSTAVFLLSALIGISLVPLSLSAQSSKSLPIGDLVKFSGAECGQIKDNWVPGTILSNGKFSTISSQISSVSGQIRKTSNAKAKAKLISKRNSLNRKLNSQKPICSVFDSGVSRPTSGVSAQAGALITNWGANVNANDFLVGATYTFFCPANGVRTSIWGTDVYTADSSICGAAVHAGLIANKNGGNVTLRVLGAQPGFNGSLRNGVSTNFFNAYSKSFVFLNPTTGAEIRSGAPLVAPWNFSLAGFRNSVGARYVFLCPANGTLGSIWGTNVYTDDSSLCTAAVHAGKASLRKGGLVLARVLPGQASYLSSRRHGVTSKSYGTWGGSYSFE